MNCLTKLLAAACMVFGWAAPISAWTAVPDCHKRAEVFLENPNEQTIKPLSGSHAGPCWVLIRPSEAHDHRFYKLLAGVKKGNRWAAQYLIAHFGAPEIDGAVLEDSLIALGVFAARSGKGMEQLMYFRKSGLLSVYSFKDSLIMLPETFVDDACGQLKELKARKNRILRITKKDLAAERAIALETINQNLSEIECDNQKAQAPVPAGWRFPSPAELADEWRGPDDLSKAEVIGDFDGDGQPDRAALLVSGKTGALGLFVLLTSDRSPKWRKLDVIHDRRAIHAMGIELVRPGPYRTACGKGYFKCKPGEPEAIALDRDAINYFKTESASRFFYHDKPTGSFKQIWMSD